MQQIHFEALKQQVDALRTELAAQSPPLGAIAGEIWCELPGHQPPWQPTGLHVTPGQQFSLFAAGRVHWSTTHPARYGGPRFHLWARVTPGGGIVNLSAESGTFTADVAGEIELGIYMGRWQDRYGALATSPDLYTRLSGALGCWVIAWQGPATTGLDVLLGCPAGSFLRSERARLAQPVYPPVGWHYLLETGTSEIYREEIVDGRRVIALEATDDQGILTTAVDVPLTQSTTLRWSWRAEQLPSTVAEDRTHTHDYFSIATEFDNGRDLTWIWSAALPPETHFHCPVPAWSRRETHFVVRQGTTNLGVWQTEQRSVYADVATAMGPPPGRIVRVWLIAVTSFQHGRARAQFADIWLEDAERRVKVL